MQVPHFSMQALVACGVVHLLLPLCAVADDLASLQGMWVSEDFAWTVEFRETTAIFRGGNPFHDQPTNDDVFPELRFRFTLEETTSPPRLNINEEDFAKFRKLLQPYGAGEVQKYAKPFQGIYTFESTSDGHPPERMQLEFYPQARHWQTKGFNDRAFAYLEFVPTRRMRRISASEAEIYRQLSGVWQGELQRDGKSVAPPLSFAVIPGWVVCAPHQHGRMRLTVNEDSGGFKLIQSSYRENSPFAIKPGFVGTGLIGEGYWFAESGDLLGSKSRIVTINWQGTFKFAGKDDLTIEVSPVPYRTSAPQRGASDDLNAIVEKAVRAASEGIAKNGTEQEKQAVAEYQRFLKAGPQTPLLTAHLTRMKQPAGEHPLSGLIRALHPDYPAQEFLEGTWQLKSQGRFDRQKSDLRKQYAHFEPVAISDAETWVFAPGRLMVQSESGARNDTYVPHVELKYGALRLKRQESDEKYVGSFQARILDGELVLTGSFFDRQQATSESWKYTLQRSK